MKSDRVLYKYMERKYAHLLLEEGKLRLGTLYGYRNTEKYGTIIGDDTEGEKSSSMPIHDEFWTDLQHPEFANNFFNFSRGSNLRISNLTLQAQQQSIDYFLFCTTETFDKTTMAAFGYDSCVEIHEPDRFFAAISNIIIAEAEFEGYFPCKYIARNLPHQRYNRIHPALIKEPRYINQKEVRSLWKPRKHPITSKVIICPTIPQYCSYKY